MTGRSTAAPEGAGPVETTGPGAAATNQPGSAVMIVSGSGDEGGDAWQSWAGPVGE